MSKMRKGTLVMLCVLVFGLFQSCASTAKGTSPEPTPTGAEMKANVSWPNDKLEVDESGIPQLKVYVVEDEKIETVDVETYVQGVLAGEMKNDWPMEALKAQAILARTFVMKFVDEKTSRYEGADVSTDIEEAQAYDRSAVNERIEQAVEETRGLVLGAAGELPYAWFHAHSGGTTERAVTGLGWDKEEPGYTKVTQGNEPSSVENEKDQQSLTDAQAWEARFSVEEFAAACAEQGVEVSVEEGTSLTVGERGEGGRAKTLNVNGQPVQAAELRIALGSTKMRSTLLTSLKVEDGQVYMAGKGYGHGVGMSQWGAYGMAEEGADAEEIVAHYFTDVTVEKLW
ncbi:MAG: SpoIID/LytB domain-containing protein [Clostridiales bacterium]|nr:SpoIID/LytB domain-containing protein [Clostridiales bacterium]